MSEKEIEKERELDMQYLTTLKDILENPEEKESEKSDEELELILKCLERLELIFKCLKEEKFTESTEGRIKAIQDWLKAKGILTNNEEKEKEKNNEEKEKWIKYIQGKLSEVKTCIATLNEIKGKLVIPFYQRQYSWEEKHIKTLLEDIKGEIKEESQYLMGSLILYKNEENEIEIVDGQQRLTTLQLILEYLGKDIQTWLKDKNDEEKKEWIKYIEEQIKKQSDDKKEESIKTLLDLLEKVKGEIESNSTNSNHCPTILKFILGYLKAESLFQGDDFKDLENKNKERIEANREYIQTWLDAEGIDKEKWIKYIFNNLEFVCVFAPSLDDSFTFFDSANSKGKKLEDYDLIKAYHIRELERDSAYSIPYYAKKFEALQSCGKRDRLDLLFGVLLPAMRQWTRHTQELKNHEQINSYDEFCKELPRSFVKYPPLFCKNSMGILQNFAGGSDFFEYLIYCNGLYEKITSLELYQKLLEIGGTGMLYLHYLYAMAMIIYLDKFPFGKIDTFAPLIARIVYSLRITQFRIYQSTIREYSKEILPFIYYAGFEEELEALLKDKALQRTIEEKKIEKQKNNNLYSGEEELRKLAKEWKICRKTRRIK